MAIQYDTLGGSVSIEPSGSIGAGDLNTAVAVVGAFDESAASNDVTAGDVETITSSTAAVSQFGEASELTRQAALAFANNAGVVYAVGLETTDQTETFTAASSGSVTNTPVMDPRVTSYEVTITDTTSSTDLTVELVDDSPSQPSDSDTAQFNHRTGEWAADASSDYEISYTTGEYQSAIETAVAENPRAVAVCTETDSVATTSRDTLETAAGNFRFSRSVVGAKPSIPATDAATYDPATDDWRVIEVPPARGTDAAGYSVRTVGAIAGLVASQPIDVTGSITYDEVSGLQSLATEYTPQEAEQFERVTALTDELEVAEGVTTASEDAFSDIYKAEIIDAVVERLHQRVKDFRGGSNAEGARRRFRSTLKRGLSAQSAPNAQPPLLADGQGGRPYSVNVSQGDVDTETDLAVGIDPAPIAKTVTVELGVGPIQFGGASV